MEPTMNFSSGIADALPADLPLAYTIQKGPAAPTHKRISRHCSYNKMPSLTRKRSRSLPSGGEDENRENQPTKFVLAGEGASQLLRSLTRSRRVLDACGEAFIPGFRITQDTGKDGTMSYKISKLDGTRGVVFAKGNQVDLVQLESVAVPALQVSGLCIAMHVHIACIFRGKVQILSFFSILCVMCATGYSHKISCARMRIL